MLPHSVTALFRTQIHEGLNGSPIRDCYCIGGPLNPKPLDPKPLNPTTLNS